MSDAAAAAALLSFAVPPAPASSRGGAVSTRAPGGQGTMRWPNGDSWEGVSKNGQRQGVGCYRWSDGRIYAGEFEANKHSGLGAQWDEDGKLMQCGRWKDDKLVEECAVPLRCIPEGTHLSAAALKAKRDHPDDSALLPHGSHYIGTLNAQGQPDQLGSSFHPDGSSEITLQVEEDASHSGRWINGKVNGRATEILDNGDRYEGVFKDSLFEGLGLYCWKNGQRYEGEFAAGKFNGFGAQWSSQGTLSKCGRWADDVCVEECAVALDRIPEGAAQCKFAYPNGSLVRLDETGRFYIGAVNERGQPHGQGHSFFPDGKPEITLRVDGARHRGQWVNGKVYGQATQNLPNGNRYVGAFKASRFFGCGVYIWEDGRRYEGEFGPDRLSGFGAMWDKDGKLIQCGQWQAGTFAEECAVPLRCISEGKDISAAALQAKRNCPDGSLVLLEDERFYIGAVNVQGQPDGLGSLFMSDGSPHIALLVDAATNKSGRWVKGKLNGRATELFADGGRYEGHYQDHQFEGLGVYVWPTGERFEGEFSAGKFNGFGAHWSSQGTLSKCGRWEDDVCVEECAVALDRIPEGKSLSAAAAQCKFAYPNGSLVRLDETGRFYIGAVNERGQPHGQV